MAKDAPPEPTPIPDAPAPPAPSLLDALRAKLAALAPTVTVERIAALADTKDVPGHKAHVKASWGRKRVAHVVEPPHSLDDAEIAVLKVVIAHHVSGVA